MRVGPCPVSLCAHTLTRKNMTDDTMAKFVLNKQARDNRLGHDFAMHAAAIEPTPQLWLRFLLGLHCWDGAGCCVNIYSASKYLLTEKKKNLCNFWLLIKHCHSLNNMSSSCSVLQHWQVWRSTSDRAVLLCTHIITVRALRSLLSLPVCLRLCLPVRLSCSGLRPVLVGGAQVGAGLERLVLRLCPHITTADCSSG